MKSYAWPSIMGLALVLSACASGITRSSEVAAQSVSAARKTEFSAVAIALTDDAKKKAAENLKFSPEELLSHVRRAVDARGLLRPGDKTLPVLQILVKDMRIRSEFTAIFGFVAGADSMRADLIIRTPAGQELDRFEVSASHSLGALGGGQDAARIGRLYDEFAEQTVKQLTRQ